MNGGRDKRNVIFYLSFRIAIAGFRNASRTAAFVKTRDETRIKMPGLEFFIANNFAKERQCGFYACDLILVQRSPQPIDALASGTSPGGKF